MFHRVALCGRDRQVTHKFNNNNTNTMSRQCFFVPYVGRLSTTSGADGVETVPNNNTQPRAMRIKHGLLYTCANGRLGRVQNDAEYSRSLLTRKCIKIQQQMPRYCRYARFTPTIQNEIHPRHHRYLPTMTVCPLCPDAKQPWNRRHAHSVKHQTRSNSGMPVRTRYSSTIYPLSCHRHAPL